MNNTDMIELNSKMILSLFVTFTAGFRVNLYILFCRAAYNPMDIDVETPAEQNAFFQVYICFRFSHVADIEMQRTLGESLASRWTHEVIITSLWRQNDVILRQNDVVLT